MISPDRLFGSNCSAEVVRSLKMTLVEAAGLHNGENT